MPDDALTLLVLDDEDAIRESFCDYFEDYGFQILSADSGEAALALLKHETPDAAIVDIRMGGMSGEDFIFKAIEQRPNCVYIICTGSPDYRQTEDLKKCPQVSDVIFNKPVTDLRWLQDEITQMVDQYNKVRNAHG